MKAANQMPPAVVSCMPFKRDLAYLKLLSTHTCVWPLHAPDLVHVEPYVTVCALKPQRYGLACVVEGPHQAASTARRPSPRPYSADIYRGNDMGGLCLAAIMDHPASEVVAAGDRSLWLGRRPKCGPGLIDWPMAREVLMQALFKRLWSDDSGQDTTEYVLLVALIALAVTAGMTVLAQNINSACGESGWILQGYVSS